MVLVIVWLMFGNIFNNWFFAIIAVEDVWITVLLLLFWWLFLTFSVLCIRFGLDHRNETFALGKDTVAFIRWCNWYIICSDWHIFCCLSKNEWNKVLLCIIYCVTSSKDEKKILEGCSKTRSVVLSLILCHAYFACRCSRNIILSLIKCHKQVDEGLTRR